MVAPYKSILILLARWQYIMWNSLCDTNQQHKALTHTPVL